MKDRVLIVGFIIMSMFAASVWFGLDYRCRDQVVEFQEMNSGE